MTDCTTCNHPMVSHRYDLEGCEEKNCKCQRFTSGGNDLVKDAL
jgi:hypothetical protein